MVDIELLLVDICKRCGRLKGPRRSQACGVLAFLTVRDTKFVYKIWISVFSIDIWAIGMFNNSNHIYIFSAFHWYQSFCTSIYMHNSIIERKYMSLPCPACAFWSETVVRDCIPGQIRNSSFKVRCLIVLYCGIMTINHSTFVVIML